MAKALFAEGIKEVSKAPSQQPKIKERQAASLFLTALMSVEAFRVTLFEGLGLNVGEASKLTCLSNFAFLTEEISKLQPKKTTHRPDGLLYLQTTKFMWSALMVTRTSGVEIETDALAHCVEIAKQNHVNAILTVCDTFTARPSILPVEIEKTTVEDLEIYHLPWGRIYTATKQVLLTDTNMSADERVILGDFVTYMEDKTRCLDANSRLQPETSSIARLVTSGATIDPASKDVLNVVASWYENLKFLSFNLREQFNCDVSVNGVDMLIAPSREQLNQDAIGFAHSNQLFGSFIIAEGAATISLKIDLLRRTANFSMLVSPVAENNKSASQLNSILKKLKNSATVDLYIKAVYGDNEIPKQAPLEQVMSDHAILNSDQSNVVPEVYEILMVRDIARDLDSMDLLVKQIDDGLLSFYEHVARNLSSPIPPRNRGPLKKTRLSDDAPVRAANENIENNGSQSAARAQGSSAEDAAHSDLETIESNDNHDITIDDEDEDNSANRLVEILGKLETFSKR
jgi:hypothetical protein